MKRLALSIAGLLAICYLGSKTAQKIERSGEEAGCKKGITTLIGPLAAMPQVQEKIEEACKVIVSRE